MMNESLQPTECLACGSVSLTRRIEEQSFVYGDGKSAATLVADVPMYCCDACGFDFMAEDGAYARDEAVHQHLNLLMPAAVVQIRRTWSLSRAAFATLTGFGVASLARWESGQIIQNESADRLLRLCQVAENIERLKAWAGITPSDPPSVMHSALPILRPAFRSLTAIDVQTMEIAGKAFSLRVAKPLNSLAV